MRFLSISIFILFFHYLLHAQAKNVDEILKRLDNHPQSDSVRTELLTDAAYAFRGNNNFLAIKYLEQAKQLGVTENTSGFVAARYLDIAEAYADLGNTKKALENFFKAEEIFTKNNNRVMITKTLVELGALYSSIGEMDKAKATLQKSLQFANLTEPSRELSFIYNLQGSLFSLEKKYDSAFYYLQKNLDLVKYLEPEDARTTRLITLVDIGLMFKKNKQFKKALEYYEMALQDSILQLDDYYQAQLLNNVASAYAAMGQWQTANQLFDSSLNISQKNQFDLLTVENHKSIAEMFEIKGDLAKENFYLKKYFHLHDSLLNKDSRNQMNELERNYEIEQQEKLLLVQKEKSKRFTLIALFIGVMALGLLYFYFRSRKRNSRLNQQNIEIEKQNLELNKLNQTKDKLFRIIGHDLRNPLVTLSAFLDKSDRVEENVTLQLKKETTYALQDTIRLLDNLLTWASAQLKNETITKRMVDLEDLIDDVMIAVKPQATLKQLTLSTTFHENARVIVSNAPMLAVVLRNLLTNAIKYSYPNQPITIKTSYADAQVQLAIIDFGIGMTPEQVRSIQENESFSQEGTLAEKGSGLGLSIVRDLLGKLDISWSIESVLNKGTTFTLYFPTT